MAWFRRKRNNNDTAQKDDRKANPKQQKRKGWKREVAKRTKTPDFTFQKNNPIVRPKRNSYPEGALPKIQCPDRSLELMSSSSGERIEDCTLAFNKGDTDDCLSFDETIKLIQDSEHLEEEQEIIYIGSGTFAIVEYEKKRDKRKMHIIKKIEFELLREEREWRSRLTYKVNIVTIDEADSVATLYSQQEKDTFSEFNP